MAVSARLPAFTTTGQAGVVARVFDQMFSPGGPFRSITAAATQPI
jgi:hypothetical protein